MECWFIEHNSSNFAYQRCPYVNSLKAYIWFFTDAAGFPYPLGDVAPYPLDPKTGYPTPEVLLYNNNCDCYELR